MLGPRRLVVARVVEAVETLEVVPAEVGAAQGALSLVIDLLVAVLADVADQDPSAIEREAKRVAQAERVDLIAAGLAHERVAARDACRLLRPCLCGSIRKSFPSRLALVLGVLVRVPGAAPVPRPRVQVAVGPELRAGRRCGSPVRGAGSRSPCGASLPLRGSPRWRGTRRSRCCPGDSCSRRRRGDSSRSVGRTRSTAGRARRPADTRPRMSRNGWALHVAPRRGPGRSRAVPPRRGSRGLRPRSPRRSGPRSSRSFAWRGSFPSRALRWMPSRHAAGNESTCSPSGTCERP